MWGLKFLRAKESEAAVSTTYLIVGLGNPGREYRNTRHNAGFMVVDMLCEAFNANLSRMQSKALTGSVVLDGRKIILAKPQTYMNLSGQAVGGLVKFYKIPLDQLLVVHDDLDLPVGTIRLRGSGGAGGQKGLGSTIQQLGTQDFPRMRIGIGRPPGQMNAADYVLQDFHGAERDAMALTLKTAVEAVRCFIDMGLETAMNRFNGSHIQP